MEKEDYSFERSNDLNALGLFVADHVDAMLAYWDKDLICRFANSAYLQWFGKDRDEMVNVITMKELLGPIFEKNIEYINGALLGKHQQFERTIPTPNSSDIRYTLANYYPHIEDGEVKGFIAHVTDISEVKKLETKNRELANIISSTSDGIISKNQDGTILTWNKGAERILGYMEEEVVGKHISIIYPPALLHETNVLISKVINGEDIEQFETIRRKKDGSDIHVSITLSAIKNEAGDISGVSKILRDITRQKLEESELLGSYERNKIFVQQAPNALAMFDIDMKYLSASEQWIRDYKLDGKNIIGKSHYEIFPEIGDDWKKYTRNAWQAQLTSAMNRCLNAPMALCNGLPGM